MNSPILSQAIENIFTINLSLQPCERVLVFTDTYDKKNEQIAAVIASTAKNYAASVSFLILEPTNCHGTEPPERLWEAAFGKTCVQRLKKNDLLNLILTKKAHSQHLGNAERIIESHREEAVHAVIALSYFSTSHTRFRDFLTRVCKTRYASMPLFDETMLAGAMMVDWMKMVKRTEQIAQNVQHYETIDISTPNGTSVSLSREGRPVLQDTGLITMPGSFSNLPAGEVYLAPREGTAHGTLVLEWSPTRKLKQPIELTVKDGLVTHVDGGDEYVDFLNQKLSEREENRNIAELGIGTNDRASRPDNILESEKILGTIHIALGDNSSFGGNVSTQFHQDFVFFKPTVILISKSGDRKQLMKNGKMLIDLY